MVNVEAGQIYRSCPDFPTEVNAPIDHFLVLDVVGDTWPSARAVVYAFETGKTHDVHARTLWRMCERIV